MKIHKHRIYEENIPQGYRALVDRLWLRGISKDEADLNGHWRDWHLAVISVNVLIMILRNRQIFGKNI